MDSWWARPWSGWLIARAQPDWLPGFTSGSVRSHIGTKGLLSKHFSDLASLQHLIFLSDINVLVQDCSNCIANALESCYNPWICHLWSCLFQLTTHRAGDFLIDNYMSLFSYAADIVSRAYPMPSRPSSVRLSVCPSVNLFTNRIGSLNFFFRSLRYLAWMCTTIFPQKLWK